MAKENDLDNQFGYYITIAKTLIKDNKYRNALDLGCNHGYLVKAFVNMGLESYGCDISADAINNSLTEVKDNLILLDITKDELPFENEKFDLITMLDVVEHLHSCNWTLLELKRVLKTGGVVYISTPSPFTNLWFKDPTHINVHPKEYWISLFTKYGFSYVGEFPKKQRKLAVSFLKQSGRLNFLNKIYSLPLIINLRSDLIFKK